MLPRDKVNFNSDVLDLIMYFASEEGINYFSRQEERILLPMASATVLYLGGDVGKIPSPNLLSMVRGWTERLNESVERSLELNVKLMKPALVEALRDLLHVEWKNERRDIWWESGIHFRLMFVPTNLSGNFYFSHAEVVNIQNKIVGRLDADTLEHCKNIGLLMKDQLRIMPAPGVI